LLNTTLEKGIAIIRVIPANAGIQKKKDSGINPE
jgi:hypothetical protein